MVASRYGRLVQEYATSFERGTIPSWLPLREDGIYAGASVAAPTAPGGGIALRTAGGGVCGVALRTARGIDLTRVKMVELQVITTSAANANTGIEIGLQDLAGTIGGGVGRLPGNAEAVFRAYGASGSVDKGSRFDSWSGGNGTSIRHSVGYRLLPNESRAGAPTRVVHFLIDGEVFSERTFTAAEFPLTTDPVFAQFRFFSTEAANAFTTRNLHRFEYREYFR